MSQPYLRICAETREAAEAERGRRTKRANRVLLAFVVGAVFFAICLCVGLAARGDSGVWRLPVDRVDVLETNHFFDENGRHVFTQHIYYTFCHGDCRHHVIAWRMHKTDHQIPHLDSRGGFTQIWVDADQLRCVRIWSLRETWTQFDVELIERQWLAREARRELFRVRPVPPATSDGQGQ